MNVARELQRVFRADAKGHGKKGVVGERNEYRDGPNKRYSSKTESRKGNEWKESQR